MRVISVSLVSSMISILPNDVSKLICIEIHRALLISVNIEFSRTYKLDDSCRLSAGRNQIALFNWRGIDNTGTIDYIDFTIYRIDHRSEPGYRPTDGRISKRYKYSTGA